MWGPPGMVEVLRETVCVLWCGRSTRATRSGGRYLAEGTVGGPGIVTQQASKHLNTVHVDAETVRVQLHAEGARDAVAGDAASAGRIAKTNEKLIRRGRRTAVGTTQNVECTDVDDVCAVVRP